VNLVNISKGGVCFTSYAEFHQGTPVSIAPYYIEGGHNIFQNGRIIRTQRRPCPTSPGEYAIEFSFNSGTSATIPGAPTTEHAQIFMLLVNPPPRLLRPGLLPG
jgi:hypothetical protein